MKTAGGLFHDIMSTNVAASSVTTSTFSRERPFANTSSFKQAHYSSGTPIAAIENTMLAGDV
ncbi:hypothetical protein [Bradyrhizobium yuanmingense]|uniref:hypothetical protein n=1 Tax=Bradyrhizobium yuanmingense TaxID=108015 RepID=UPI0023B974EA|nr:hypothetical protein [Bradyrhizobium yuanmingense]MDF0582014.1 hypothetical protein [Bradyrhizobium yuanmingense]